MSEAILTNEEALFKHDGLKFAEESEPLLYRCDQLEINGILLVTNLRMSFYYRNESGELSFIHYLFNMTKKVKFYTNSQTNIVEINSAYEWTTFIFRSRTNLFEFREFLNRNFPEKIETSEQIKSSPLKNKMFQKENKVETSYQSDEKKLFKFENWYSFKNGVFSIFIYVINIIFIIGIWYGISTYFPEYRQSILSVANYPSYWLNKQRVEKDMYIIAKKMKQRNEYPQNITEFILANFKIVGNDNKAKDPWGNLYDVEYKNNNFRLISYGPDKKKETNDDISKEFAKINK